MKKTMNNRIISTCCFSFKPFYVSTLEIDYSNKIIFNMLIDRTYDYIIERFPNDVGISIFDKDGNVVDHTAKVKSYDKVVINYQGEDIEYTVTVLGDANGDGIVDNNDLRLIMRAMSSKNYSMFDYYIMDINKDGFVLSDDYDMVRRYISGEINSLRLGG